jgi:hypothetical protein
VKSHIREKSLKTANRFLPMVRSPDFSIFLRSLKIKIQSKQQISVIDKEKDCALEKLEYYSA